MVVETIWGVTVSEKSQLCLCFCFLKKRSPFFLTQRFPDFLVLHSFKLLEVIFKANEHYLWVIISIFVILNFKTENWFIGLLVYLKMEVVKQLHVNRKNIFL